MASSFILSQRGSNFKSIGCSIASSSTTQGFDSSSKLTLDLLPRALIHLQNSRCLCYLGTVSP
ncbi:hypothetical protein L1049_005492 [Liquidambar formosana]|uniref:Uncharacterized protein n=1 Tax=Liquidambar formosana TaxID=63359 RepID=A0AAP0RVR3_LIQFO